MDTQENYDGPLSKLRVWQLAIDFAAKYVPNIDKIESKVLRDQLFRSITSIPSNIAEGYGRNSSGDYARFLRIALGSTFEAESQLIILSKVGGYLDDSERALNDLKVIRIKLFKLIKAIKGPKALESIDL